MSARIEAAVRLKQEWSGRRVVVDGGDARLKRFAGRIGTVKTVNMNGHALVEFGGADVAWYDIAPERLREATVEEIAAAEPPKKKPAAKADSKKPVPSAAAPAGRPLSPLEQARAEDAAGATTTERKLSPLEQARAQDAAAGKPSTTPAKPLSPLERARQQDAGAGETPADGRPLSALERARLQDAGTAPAAPAPATATTESSVSAVSADGGALPPTGPARTAAILKLAREQGGPS